MQQYSSLPEQNSQLDANSANSSTVLTTIEQLRAELWLECSLNQLQSQLNDCLTLALSRLQGSNSSEEEQISRKVKEKQQTQTSIAEAEILQTLVTELRIALNSSMLALPETSVVALAVVQPQTTVCKISYISSDFTNHSKKSSLSVAVRKGKKLQLKFKEEIEIEDLQQLENKQPQAAFRLTNDSLEIIGWLIVSPESLINSSSGISIVEQFPRLMADSSIICMKALAQLKQVESLRQEAQEFNDRNQELQRTNQLKNQFLANTSHEIRTPLSSIIGFTHLLLAQGYDPSKQRHHEYLNIIQSSGKHLLALINDILDLSKIEANQLEVNWETVDVPQLCRNVLALVKEKAANKGLQMCFDIDPNVVSMVADPLRLKQILLNLLFNAIKFTKTGTVGLEVKPKDDLMYFAVWDTGIGISKENQSELFQPYFQIFNERHINGEEGTGLGLTVTRKLTEIHGGWVEVKSEVNEGSRFTIVVPVEQNSDAKLEKDCAIKKLKAQTENNLTASASSKNSSDILLVEDDIPNAQLIKTYLERLRYRITWVKSASGMWDALKNQDYSIILIDIILPDANGISLVKKLRGNARYSNTCIIAQTAMAMKGDRDTCMKAGVNDYICKPIDLPLLAKIISQYITIS